VDNSIKLKELQVENGALRKGHKGLQFFFLFQKGFFWVRRGGWGNSTPFQRRLFLRDWDRWFFFGMGTNPKRLFLGWHRREKFGCFEGMKVGFLKTSKELFFWWCGMGCLEKAKRFFFFFFLWYGDLINIFSQTNIL